MEVTTELLIAEWRTLREAADQLRCQVSDARSQLRQRYGELIHYRCGRRQSIESSDMEGDASYENLLKTA